MTISRRRIQRFSPLLRAGLANPLVLMNQAVARFDPDTIIGTNPVTAWNTRGINSAFDINVVVGTGANLSILDSGVALHPGGTGNNFTTPDSAAASVTDDITLEWIGYMFDWTPSVLMDLIAKWDSGASKESYILRLNSDGTIKLLLSQDGFTPVDSTSQIPNGFTAGNLGGVRARWDQSANTVDFESSSDGGVTWNAMGDQRSLIISSIDDNNAILEIGSVANGNSNLLAGKTVRARVYNDATATNVVVDFDPTKAVPNVATFTSGGAVWTANGDCFVNASGHRGIYSRGSVGIETTAGQLLTGQVTVYAVLKPTLASPSADQFIFDARSNTNARMSLLGDDSASDRYGFFQGLQVVNIAQGFSNASQVYTVQFLGTASSKLTVAAGSVTGDGGSDNWDFGSILIDKDGIKTMQGLFHELLVFDRAHNVGEISRIQNFLAAKYSL